VLVVAGMLLALATAASARLDAREKDRARQLDLRRRRAAQYLRRGVANVSAVEVESDTPPKAVDVLLRETGIRAQGARLRAVDAFLDAAHQRFLVSR
jgi:hypothetical protein